MAIEVSIQAVSPELGEHSFWTFESHGSVSTVGPAAVSSAAGAGSCANEGVKDEVLRVKPRRTANKSAVSPARIGFLNVMILLLSVDDEGAGSDRRSVGFAGADTHGAFEVEDEDLAVPDLPGFRRPGDGVDGLVDLVGRDRHFDFDLRQETHGVFGTAIDFRMALL